MNRTARGLLCSGALALTLSTPIVVPSALGQSNRESDSAFTISPVLLRGDRLGGGKLVDANFEAKGFNDRGDIAFSATTTVDGTFTATNVYLLRDGAATPIGEPGTQRYFFSRPSINERGQGVYVWNDTSSGTSTRVMTMFDGARTVELLRQGATVGSTGQVVVSIPDVPSINEAGEIAFDAALRNPSTDFATFGIFKYVQGQLVPLVLQGDSFGENRTFNLYGSLARNVWIADDGSVLFSAETVTTSGPFDVRRGLFRWTPEGVQEVVVAGAEVSKKQTIRFVGYGPIPNSRGEVAVRVGLTDGIAESGIYVPSSKTIERIVAQEDRSPIGGEFSNLFDLRYSNTWTFFAPSTNDRGAVLFLARSNQGGDRTALYLGSPRAVVKVVATGDMLPTGERVAQITSYALNNNGQVVFAALTDKPSPRHTQLPVGIFIASPVTPVISAVDYTFDDNTSTLTVDATGLVAGDCAVEVEGVEVGDLTYPVDFRSKSGIGRRVVSTDDDLFTLVNPGSSYEVTVVNRLTGARSAPFRFSPD